MPKCENCGRFVSHSFIRVIGRNGQVDGCPECIEREMAYGKGVVGGDDRAAQF